ncbi:hypothetical protein BDV06DRAFT_208337 [Aspergillus oleicola]
MLSYPFILPLRCSINFRVYHAMEPPESDTPNKCSTLTRSDTIPIQTQYIQMLLDLDYIPWYYNIASSTANWVLLAGYLSYSRDIHIAPEIRHSEQ